MKKEKEISLSYRIFSPPSEFNLEELVEKIKSTNSSSIIQIIDPRWVVSNRQLKVAVYHTLKAFETKRNIARDVATEFLIRLSGKRQISSAVELFGINKESLYFLVLAFGGLDKENQQSLASFVKESKILIDKEVKQSLPLTEKKELSKFYECKEDIEEIEKKALENMAMIEAL